MKKFINCIIVVIITLITVFVMNGYYSSNIRNVDSKFLDKANKAVPDESPGFIFE